MGKEHKKNGFDKFLDIVEKVGNKVPHPVMMFFYFAIATIIASHIMHLMGVSVTYQAIDIATMEPVMLTVYAESLLTTEGIRFIFTSMISNYQNMPAKTVILVAMIGAGVAEGTGLIGSLIRKTLLGAPARVVTYTVVFLGIMSSVASDAGYLVLIPLGGVIFHSMGRHPVAGVAAAFAGVSGGFGANLLLTPTDAMMVEITNEAIALMDPSQSIDMLANYYFSFVSTFLVTLTGGLVTEKIVEPRLGTYTGNVKAEDAKELTAEENRGLKFALIGFLAFVAIISLITFPQGSALRNPETGEILGTSPFMDSIVPLIMFMFLIPGAAYGYGAKTIENSKDIIKHATKALEALGGLLVIIFVISQFLAYFNYSRIGTIIAVQGAFFLEAIGFTGVALIISFVLLCGLINFVMGGMITKWAVLAPVFIPMFMQMGISPAMTQAAYRIGDSATNIVNPIMSWFAIVLLFFQKYDEDTGVGTVIATMMPYAIWFMISWIFLIIVWYFLGLPLGPGAYIRM